MDRNFALEFVRVTEAAALSSHESASSNERGYRGLASGARSGERDRIRKNQMRRGELQSAPGGRGPASERWEAPKAKGAIRSSGAIAAN